MRQLPRTLYRIPQLPKQIRRHPTIFQRQAGLLPAPLHRTVVLLLGYAIFLKQTRFVELLTDPSMRFNPAVAKRVAYSPAIRVQVEGAKTYVAQSQICFPVYAFGVLVGVRAVTWKAEAFIADRDHVI